MGWDRAAVAHIIRGSLLSALDRCQHCLLMSRTQSECTTPQMSASGVSLASNTQISHGPSAQSHTRNRLNLNDVCPSTPVMTRRSYRAAKAVRLHSLVAAVSAYAHSLQSIILATASSPPNTCHDLTCLLHSSLKGTTQITSAAGSSIADRLRVRYHPTACLHIPDKSRRFVLSPSA